MHLFFLIFIYLFLEKGEGREKGEGEKHQCVVASRTPLLGTWPTTQACALTRNQTSDPLVCRPALNPLSRTSQGQFNAFKLKLYSYSLIDLFKKTCFALNHSVH